MKIHIGKANVLLFIKILVQKLIENHMTFKILNASHQHQSIIDILGPTSICRQTPQQKTKHTIRVLRHSYFSRSDGQSPGSQLDIRANGEEWQNQVLTSLELHRKRQPSHGYPKVSNSNVSGLHAAKRHSYTQRPYDLMYVIALVTTAVGPTHNCTCISVISIRIIICNLGQAGMKQ